MVVFIRSNHGIGLSNKKNYVILIFKRHYIDR